MDNQSRGVTPSVASSQYGGQSSTAASARSGYSSSYRRPTQDITIPKDAYVKYTKALLNGRHPRSFRPVTAIWAYM